jgi:hypothetical protein
MEDEVQRRFERIEALLETGAERQTGAEARAHARMDRAEAHANARMDRAEAHANARFDRANARMDRAEVRADRADARAREMQAQFEKRMRGFEKLAKIGMKEIVELRRLDRENEHKLNALIDSQQRTDTTLRALMNSLSRGGNGHGHNGGRSR